MNDFYNAANSGGYFKVTTDEVLFRIKKSVFPLCIKGNLIEYGKEDFYGPIWIMITLIVEISIFGFINYVILKN